jgi:hypothetical protein
MDLKELLGEELYTQVAEKAGDNKIAVVSDGKWIPKDKFDEKNGELKDLKDQLAERDKQLKDLQTKAAGNEELQAEITRLQQENENTRTDYEQKLQAREFDFALESALRDAKAKNPKAVKALINMEAIKLADGKLVGLEEQLKALRESDDYLFVPDGLKGKTPPGTPPNPSGYEKPNPFSRDTLNLTEQGRLLREDPDLAKQLQAQAKK